MHTAGIMIEDQEARQQVISESEEDHHRRQEVRHTVRKQLSDSVHIAKYASKFTSSSRAGVAAVARAREHRRAQKSPPIYDTAVPTASVGEEQV